MIEIGAFLIAAFVTGFSTIFLIRSAHRIGLVDHPQGRKDHEHPAPVVGGVAMWLGICAALIFSGFDASANVGLVGAGALMVGVGAIDDRFDLSWRVRIFTQVIAASMLAILAGVVLERLGHGQPPFTLMLGWLAIPVTVFAIVGLINAVNMIDGVDGLAGSLVLCSLIAMLLLHQDGSAAPSLTISIAAVSAFLLFNLRFGGRTRALTFMGNSGSALLGLLLAWAAIRVTHDPQSPITPALGPWLVALPVIDCLAIIVRRIRSGRSPFAADRSHFHHLLLDRGYSVNKVVGFAVVTHCALALIGWTLHVSGVPDIGLIGLFLLVIAVFYAVTGMLTSARRVEEIGVFASVVSPD